ncbi:MAG: MBL fold metallo-hydrolase [Myxococcales bacterium]|nr:MBL fold metallo-hydrolase [Myxococcales bacterium]
MRWSSLGHACWLVEAAGLRLLCDPLLEAEHQGGVFESAPRRRLKAEALRPDFILISHAHPDHFDVPSLARLAELDRDSVVVSPDPLVVEAALALGFSTVHRLAAGQRVALDGLTLVTTASVAEDEWGLMIADGEGTAWNQVDTVFRSPAHARTVIDEALAALDRPRIDLALVQGRPMHEISAQLGRAVDFPFADYGRLLAELAAIDAAVLVPSAADTAHTRAFAWLNSFVYPVDETRLRRDLARICPQARVLAAGLGDRLCLRDGAVEHQAGAALELIETDHAPVDRGYRPFAVATLVDHDDRQAFAEPSPTLEQCRHEVRRWLETVLAPALRAAYPGFGVTRPLRFVVEAVFPGAGDACTLEVEADGVRIRDGADPDWDLYNLAIGTMLWAVLDGRRSWSDLLLAGGLRASSRAYEVGEGGLARARVGLTFLYYGLSHRESVRRSVERAVARELARRSD